MRQKNKITQSNVPFSLLKKGLTTPEDLRKIAEMLGFHIDYIDLDITFH